MVNSSEICILYLISWSLNMIQKGQTELKLYVYITICWWCDSVLLPNYTNHFKPPVKVQLSDLK